MALLNHLFRSRRDIGRELGFDNQKRLSLWLEHVKNYEERETLARRFNFANIDSFLQNPAVFAETIQKLKQLISEEFVHINDEERTDDEIRSDLQVFGNLSPDLKRFLGEREFNKPVELNRRINEDEKFVEPIQELFRRIYDVLKLELHTIRLIEKKPHDVKGLLLRLFGLIFHYESNLYKLLVGTESQNTAFSAEIFRVIRGILLGEELAERVKSAEDEFVFQMVKALGDDDSKHRYRKLAESVFVELMESYEGNVKELGESKQALEHVKSRLYNDAEITAVIAAVIRRQRLRYALQQIPWIIRALRQSFEDNKIDEVYNLPGYSFFF